MEDAMLKDDIMSALEWEPDIDFATAGVSVTEGLVTLFGHVPTLSQRHAVEQAVLRVRGVTTLANEIEVVAGRSDRTLERLTHPRHEGGRRMPSSLVSRSTPRQHGRPSVQNAR